MGLGTSEGDRSLAAQTAVLLILVARQARAATRGRHPRIGDLAIEVTSMLGSGDPLDPDSIGWIRAAIDRHGVRMDRPRQEIADPGSIIQWEIQPLHRPQEIQTWGIAEFWPIRIGRLIDDPYDESGYTCRRCGSYSRHPEDVKHGYCGRCHGWTSAV